MVIRGLFFWNKLQPSIKMGLYKNLRVTAIINETADTKTFVLEPKTPADNFSYEAGQFLTLVFHRPFGEERRSFSISSSPALNEPLMLTIKRVENGAYSRLLLDKGMVGDEWQTIGASGFFVFPPLLKPYRQIFFFAAGSGITPVFSLIKTLLFTEPNVDVVLIYSNRNINTTIFYKELNLLLSRFSTRFKIEFLFSTAPNLARARLSKWLLEILLNEYKTAVNEECLFYLCGPYEYMRMASIGLVANGIAEKNIHKEDFIPLKLEPKELPPDKNAHLVFINVNGETHKIEVQYPETILSAAKKAGLQMPYSCEAGRCGTCVARCTSGKVWMSYNEVLMDDEMAKGLVLTCTGYPVGEDVYLDI